MSTQTQSVMPLAVKVQGEGTPILCLHGHPGSGKSLSVFTSIFPAGYQTVTPDLRGYGQSQVQSAFKMSDHLQDLNSLWEQYDLDHCIILGWSLGGILAIEMALLHPDRVRGLILVGTAARPYSSHPPITWVDNLYTAIAGLINSVWPSWQWNIETFGKRSLFRYLICRHTPEAYQYLAQEAVSAYLRTSTYANQALNLALKAGYDRLDQLERITCPCLVLAGECDRHITPESSQETARFLPCSDWVCYPNTAHLFPWEVPKQVQDDILRWLQQHPAL